MDNSSRAGARLYRGAMSTVAEEPVLLAPEEEFVPEDDQHVRLVDVLFNGLRERFLDEPAVAVHARLAWFPDAGDTRVRLDPDVMVVRGRPQVTRRSYRQWAEDGVAPQVLLEVVSGSDAEDAYLRRMSRALRHGAQEVVLVRPYAVGGMHVEHLVAQPDATGGPARWRSTGTSATAETWLPVPSLGIELSGGDGLQVRDESGPWGDPALAIRRARHAEVALARQAARTEQEAARADRLAARLRELGVDPS